MQSAREEVRGMLGVSCSLNEKQIGIIETIVDMCDVNSNYDRGSEIYNTPFAKAVENAINNFSFNEKLFAKELTNYISKLDEPIKEIVSVFVEYLVYSFCSNLKSCYQRNCYDLRNEASCQNAIRILADWNYDENATIEYLNDVHQNMSRLVAKTTEYWTIHMHRTLQQTWMRVMVEYLALNNKELTTPLEAMGFI